ncbi:MAG: glycosyltransferase family 4 protein [Bifidobacteriaceae bacterium]|nr:glycosyltransferase family 4 protein [Bifidobacteriaceae bacterium]
MRIVQLRGPSDGGIRAHIDMLVRAQRAAGHQVAVIEWVARPRVGAVSQGYGSASATATLSPTCGASSSVDRGAPPVTSRDREGSWFQAGRWVARSARSADVVHAHGLKAGALAVLASRAAGRRRSRPAVVVTLHNLPVGSRRVRAMGAVLARVVARSHAVLGVSEDVVAWAGGHGVRGARWTPVPAPALGLPCHRREEVRTGLGVPTGVALLVTVGRLAPQKGLDLAIDAAVHLNGATPPFVWLIAGEGPERARLAARIERAGVPIRLLGRRDDLPDLYHAADLVVSTAIWEGQPLGLQEALRCGTPVVATDVGGTRGVVGSGGLLVDRSPRKLAAAIVRVLDSPELLADLRIKARRRGRDLPKPADMMAHVSAVYARAVADG